MTYASKRNLYRRAAETLLRIAELASRAADPVTAIQRVLLELSTRMGMDRCQVVLGNGDAAVAQALFHVGSCLDDATAGQNGKVSDAVESVMHTGRVAVFHGHPGSLYDLQAPSSLADEQRETAVGTVLAPIVAEGQALGVLACQARTPSTAAYRIQVWICQAVAGVIGPALRRFLMEQKQAQTSAVATAAVAPANDAKVYGILGRSPELEGAIHTALRAAQSNATVLLTGESGCGKERFARMIHLASDRSDHPFVCLNCAAIPKDLLESELFGHERGSFTGAVADRIGKFELASRGTLFLDEVGDMPVDLQAKLLRVLQERTVQRVGSSRETPVDVRIIAATNLYLEDLVNEGRFRVDLFFRLNVLRVHLPPLRERRGDVKLLALYFLNRENQRYSRNIVVSGGALELLEAYPWPGNVRQLENVMERLVLMMEGDIAMADDIHALLEQEADINLMSEKHFDRLAVPVPSQTVAFDSMPARPYQRVTDEERKEIEEALRTARGNKTYAARQLGLTPRQLYYRLAKLGIT